MKTQILVIALSLFCLTANAQKKSTKGNEGPQASPTPTVIAQVVSGTGFVPNHIPHTRTISILSSGLVKQDEAYYDGRVVSKTITTLSADVATNLEKMILSIKDTGDLVDPNPIVPGCYDAPGKTYYAVRADGTRIEVAGERNCKVLNKVDEQFADRELKEVLNAMITLAGFLK